MGHARAALDAGVSAARDARGELQRRVDQAKRAYRAGRDGNGEEGDGADAATADADTPAALAGGDIVVTEVTTEEDQGDLA